MRKIITGLSVDRSTIIINEQVPADLLAMLWDTSREEPLGFAPTTGVNEVPHVPPGHMSWRVVSVPPDAVMREFFEKGVPGLDERGFHTTHTIDFVFVMDGPITMAVDDQEVDLEPGDVVVQRATRHAWFNRTDRNVKLLVLLAGI